MQKTHKKLAFFNILKYFILLFMQFMLLFQRGEVMWNFINPTYYCAVAEPFGNGVVLGVGYDNFNVTRPLLRFWVQNTATWHFVISGKGMLEIGGKSYSLRAGDMFFIPPGIEKRYYPSENEPWEYVWFSLDAGIAESYGSLAGFSLENPTRENRHAGTVNTILKNLFAELTNGRDGQFKVLSAFYKIMDICASHIPSDSMQSIRAYIDANCTTQLFNVETLCKNAGLSHAHLLRLFKKEYGDTLIGYITKKRIEYACELLETTSLSVSTVAFSSGFSDEIHFMKTFKRITGTTALKYRVAAEGSSTKRS